MDIELNIDVGVASRLHRQGKPLLLFCFETCANIKIFAKNYSSSINIVLPHSELLQPISDFYFVSDLLNCLFAHGQIRLKHQRQPEPKSILDPCCELFNFIKGTWKTMYGNILCTKAV